MWFHEWEDIWRIVISGLAMFIALLTSIRLAGNRTLASMNASDFIIVVAVGTTFASTMLSGDVAVASGVAAVVTLVALQAFTVWLSIKHPQLRQRFEGDPVLLLRHGEPILQALKRARVSEVELRQAVRQQGFGGFEGLAAVVLEANGNFSVIPSKKLQDGSAIPDARRDRPLAPQHDEARDGGGAPDD